MKKKIDFKALAIDTVLRYRDSETKVSHFLPSRKYTIKYER